MKSTVQLLYGVDVREGLRQLPDLSVHCVVTSPAYWGLRDYGTPGQLGKEKTPEEYVRNTLEWAKEIWRVLRADGTFWLNLGDSFSGSGKGIGSDPDPKWAAARTHERNIKTNWKDVGLKPKDLVGIPWRVAFALQQAGWHLRRDIIWDKPNPMPESVRDRPSSAHEYIFLLTKSPRYFYDAEAIAEPACFPEVKHKSQNKSYEQESAHFNHAPTNLGRCGTNDAGTRNARSVWHIATMPYKGSHYATFPPELPARCIKAGTSEYGCCPSCAAPYTRIIENTSQTDESAKGSRFDQGKTAHHQLGRAQSGLRTKKQEVGWKPSCSCSVDPASDSGFKFQVSSFPPPVPCTVLDPFAGSGTTLEVAARLGRNVIGIDLDPRNRKLTEQRLAQVGGLLMDRKYE